MQNREGAALGGPVLPLHPAVSGVHSGGTGGTKGQKPKAECLDRERWHTQTKDISALWKSGTASYRGNVSSPANHLREAFPRLFPSRPAPPSPVCREAGSSHVEDYPCLCSPESPQPWQEVSGNATRAFSFFPFSHAPRLLGGGEQQRLSQPHTDQPPRTLRPAAAPAGPQLQHREQRSRK